MDSIVARLVKNQISAYEVDPETPFAELWMGTHPSGPTVVVSSNDPDENMTLKSLLTSYPEYVGNIEIVEKYGRNLPFLFKVLSVGKALSIQAHPNKQLAEELYANDPSHYTDPNHKPELAIALTDFEALCGFRPHSEIEVFLDSVPEFKAVVGAEAVVKYKKSDKKHGLKPFFTAFMTSPESIIQQNLESLVTRWSKEEQLTDPAMEEMRKLFLRLHDAFPKDIGCFSIFFLNVLHLKPGEAIFLGPDEPHAYILGDCIECMACSDNVVRAGLTPKYKDVKILCSMLTYKTKSAAEQLLEPKVIDEFTKSYVPPFPEFGVDVVEIKGEHVRPDFEYKLAQKESGSIALIIHGDAQCQGIHLSQGYIGFIPAMTPLTITNIKSDLLLYRAFFRLD